MQLPNEQLVVETVSNAVCRATPAARGGALVMLVVALSMAWGASTLLRLDLVFTAAGTEVGFWGREEYEPNEPTRTRVGQNIDLLLSSSRAHPDFLTLAASYYGWQAYWAQTPHLEQDYNHRALDAQIAAQQNRPAYRQGWATMLGYAARADQVEAGSLARQRLLALAPSTRSSEPAR